MGLFLFHLIVARSTHSQPHAKQLLSWCYHMFTFMVAYPTTVVVKVVVGENQRYRA